MSNNIKYEKIEEITLPHLPNNAKLVIQRQTSELIGDNIQFFIATKFVDKESNNIVWHGGFSIQLDNIQELVDILENVLERYNKDNNTSNIVGGFVTKDKLENGGEV